MKKIYLALITVFFFSVSNAQKIYFKQTFDNPTFDGSTNYISTDDYYGPPVSSSSTYIQIASSCLYSSPTPDSSQFTFIGTGTSGTDSLVPDGNGGYAMMLNKFAGTSNSCTLARSVALADSVPDFLVINYDVTPSEFSVKTVSASLYCTVGVIKDTLRSENTLATGETARVGISCNGGATNIFRLRDPVTPATMGVDSFTTGSKYTVTFVLNNSTDSIDYHTYQAPNGSMDSVLGGRWEAWITTSGGVATKELTSRKIPFHNPMQGFRFLVTNTPQETYLLDNILITDGASSTLPISLAKFNAARINATTASVTWTVASATNIKEFEVSKSTDGTNFKSIGTVPFAGIQSYSFNDNYLGTGTSYYRLVSIDKDGAEHYSSIASVENKASGIALLSLAPNLVRSSASLNISSTKADNVIVRVFDLLGRTVQEKAINIPEGNSQTSFDFGFLKSGSYFLETISSDGSVKTTRFEKQ